MTETINSHERDRRIIAEFRANGGTIRGADGDRFLILVHHVGATSGIERVSPLLPLRDGDRIFIFASKGGAPRHPAWYHNLVANPDTTVEYGPETFPVHARVLTGAERDEVYAAQVAAAPQFGDYQRNTDRVIPVIELQRTDR